VEEAQDKAKSQNRALCDRSVESERSDESDSSDGSNKGKGAIQESPSKWIERVLGEPLYQKQREFLDAVPGNRRVSVVGCNGSGKDWAAARLVLWWMEKPSPAKAIVTGPTTRQVNDIVWSEMRRAYSMAAGRLQGKMFRTARYEVSEESFALGFATDSPYNLQRFHSPNLLVVVTEAHAVRTEDINAMRRLNPSRLVMTGNPFVMAGAFYDSHHSKRHLYRTVHISAFDTPNVIEGRTVVPGMVSAQDIRDRKDEWGENSSLYIGGVLGRFPDSLDNSLVPLHLATAAANRGLTPSGPVIVACDVARFGNDKTVAVRRQCPHARIIWRVKGRDTMQVAGWLKGYCDANRVDVLVVDDTGVGGGVVDRLREAGIRKTRLVPFIAGASASDRNRRYANRITEAWFRMAEAYREGSIDTDDDPALIGQVASRQYTVEGDSAVRLMGKHTMGGSPD